jgi:hypothetical protein
MDKSPADLLAEAKSILMEKGVGTKNFYNPVTDQYCSLGAIRKAAGFEFAADRVVSSPFDESGKYKYLALDNAEWALFETMGQTVPLFNDSHSPGEVLARFDDAILYAKEKFNNG